MNLLSNPNLWILVASLAVLSIAWRFWVYYNDAQELPFRRQLNARNAQIAMGIMILSGVGLAWSLTNLILSRGDSFQAPPALPATATLQSDPSPTPIATPTPTLSTSATPTAEVTETPIPSTPTLPATSQTALIGNTNGFGVNVRSSPGLSAQILTTLPDNTQVTLLEENTSADGFNWQSVQLENGSAGWIAEQFLIPE